MSVSGGISWRRGCCRRRNGQLHSRALVSRTNEARSGTQGQHDGTFQIHRFCHAALGPGSSLADARSAGTREWGARFTSVRGIARSEPLAVVSTHNVKQRSVLRSRGAFVRPGSVFPFASTPIEGWAERRQAHLFCCRACEARPSALVRRGASHDAGRSPLGAPPWRFSAGGRASISGIASGSVQRAPRSQVIMPGGRCPGPPEPAVTSRSRRTPLPAPPAGSSPEDAPHERGWESYTTASLRSQ